MSGNLTLIKTRDFSLIKCLEISKLQ